MSFEDKKDYSGEKTDVLPALETGNYDHEDGINAFGQRKDEKLAPALKPRHMAMISIGGVIGTGLFLGTGSALHGGGPLGLFLGYALMGSVTYCMMQCLGEMLSYLPIAGGHIKLAERFVGKPLSLALGYNYAFNWLIVLPAELSAAAVLVSFWSDLNPAIFIAIFLVIVVAINMLGARAYGETEFWFASIKILTIIGLIILSICIDLGAGDQGRLGFQYWKNPGPFAQYAGIQGSLGQFLGFFSVLIQASFSYIGTEIVAIAAGEARNPRRTIPSAIRKVWIRIVAFYLLGTFCIGLICPSNADQLTVGNKTSRSPFVIAIRLAGIKGLPSVINACLITSAVSAASSDMYSSSRAMYGLAIAGQMPRIFARTTKRGLPYVAVLTSVLFSGLAFMSCSSGAATAFGWFANMTSVCGLSSWFCIAWMHTRFHKGMVAQGISRDVLPFTSKYAKYYAYYVLVFTTVVIFFSAWSVFLKANAPFDASTFVTSYIPVPIFWLLFFGSWFFYGKKSMLKVEEIDFVTGVQELIDEEYDEPAPRNLWEKFWSIVA